MVTLYLLASVLNIWMVVEMLDGCIVLIAPALHIWIFVEILDGYIVLTGPCSEHLDGCRDT
jgi:hypothetical protein